MTSRVFAVVLVLAALALGSVTHAQTVQHPPPGSAERRAILDTVRPLLEQQVGPPVEFVVNDIRIVGQFAFVAVEPQRPGGGRIDYSHLTRGDDADFFDGLRTEAILTRRDGRWLVAHYGIGSTDVWYVAYCDSYPRALIPMC